MFKMKDIRKQNANLIFIPLTFYREPFAVLITSVLKKCHVIASQMKEGVRWKVVNLVN